VTADELGDFERCHESRVKSIVCEAAISLGVRVVPTVLRI
jgi:hypothetical protein